MKKRYILIVLTIIITLFSFLYYKEGSRPVNSTDTSTKMFVVEKGATVNTIVKNLSNEGLIRDKIVFFFIIKQLGIENKIQAGDFRLSPSMDSFEIASQLTKGTVDVWVTIIEGLRKEEVAAIVSRELGISEVEFASQAKEGYLFPDTYLIPKNATIKTVLSILYNTFDEKYTKDIDTKINALGLSKDQAITIASLVEREAKAPQDRQIVASIMLKRLNNNWPLQIDATVQYALGFDSTTQKWWKQNLTKDDLAISSPYNTYKNQGLPPGPIGNPGLSSLEAVSNADVNTPYWYYISNAQGTDMHYAKTIEEHNNNIAKYLHK